MLVPSKDNKNKLESQKEALKMLDGRKNAKDLMYAKQKWFDYCDKTGKQLSWLLSRDFTRNSVTKLRNNSCILIALPEEKLEGFFFLIHLSLFFLWSIKLGYRIISNQDNIASNYFAA